MTTPYNTGKVKIGGAYVPRMKPETSHGITGPHKRPFFDRADRIVMRVALLAVLAFGVIMLAGCKEDQPATFKPATHRDLITWGPDEHGVKCYRQQGIEALSCVQVVPR